MDLSILNKCAGWPGSILEAKTPNHFQFKQDKGQNKNISLELKPKYKSFVNKMFSPLKSMCSFCKKYTFKNYITSNVQFS